MVYLQNLLLQILNPLGPEVMKTSGNDRRLRRHSYAADGYADQIGQHRVPGQLSITVRPEHEEEDEQSVQAVPAPPVLKPSPSTLEPTFQDDRKILWPGLIEMFFMFGRL
jgi:hypothetical protein